MYQFVSNITDTRTSIQQISGRIRPGSNKHTDNCYRVLIEMTYDVEFINMTTDNY